MRQDEKLTMYAYEGMRWANLSQLNSTTVVGTSLCVPHPLEAIYKRVRGVKKRADKEVYTVHNMDIISQWQYSAVRCIK
jgi:hypothetical protein